MFLHLEVYIFLKQYLGTSFLAGGDPDGVASSCTIYYDIKEQTAAGLCMEEINKTGQQYQGATQEQGDSSWKETGRQQTEYDWPGNK